MNETSENSNNSNSPFKPEDLLELQEIINKEIFSSKVQEKEMQELQVYFTLFVIYLYNEKWLSKKIHFQAKINQKLLNSKVFNFEHQGLYRNTKKMNRLKSSSSAKARTMMNLHNNEAGRRVSKMQFFTHFIVPLYSIYIRREMLKFSYLIWNFFFRFTTKTRKWT